jgi:hypothetical protein
VYFDTLRAAGSEQLESAIRLVPLKIAHESRAYARALD